MAEAEPRRGITALYCAIDTDRSGWFSLGDWDKAAFKVLGDFTRWANKKHHKVTDFVRSLEENTGDGIESSVFRRAIKDVGLDSDEFVMLFDGLTLNSSSGCHRSSLQDKPPPSLRMEMPQRRR